MVVGDPAKLAIESHATRYSPALSQRGLGYFLIHVGGNCYGVRAPEATLLACSFDAVGRRLARRGRHSIPEMEGFDGPDMASAYVRAYFCETSPAERFLGRAREAFQASVDKSEVVWAPDGDEAFDDGSFVLQFDEKDKVRVLAFRRGKGDSDISDLADVRLDPDEFYGVLGSWHSQFELERMNALP